jgi:hypothetical protein
MTTDKLFMYVFCLPSASAHKRTRNSFAGVSRVEAGSNTSTVTLRVVVGDKKGRLKSERVKYGRESHGTQTRVTALARASSNYKRQTRSPVRERAPYKNTRNCLTVIKTWS